MDKGETIVLRVSGETKATIRAAAQSQGKSLTTFITEAAVRQARQVERRRPARGVHGGVPTFFRACCFEAGRGGTNGYASAAWNLANSIGSQIPYDVEIDEWQSEVEALTGLIEDGEDDGVWQWFKRHYPKCMALVPARRRAQFVEGVRRAHEDGRIAV